MASKLLRACLCTTLEMKVPVAIHIKSSISALLQDKQMSWNHVTVQGLYFFAGRKRRPAHKAFNLVSQHRGIFRSIAELQRTCKHAMWMKEPAKMCIFIFYFFFALVFLSVQALYKQWRLIFDKAERQQQIHLFSPLQII